MRLLATLGLVLLAAPASAERMNAGVTDVTAVSDSRGSTRILFRAGPTQRMENVAVRRAWLRWTAGEGEVQRVALQVHAMGGEWNAGGADWASSEGLNAEVYSRQEVELGGAREIRLDVTRLVKEILEQGTAPEGFVLTVDPTEGDGLRQAMLEGLGDLGQATLQVEYRRAPPLPTSRRAG